MSSKLRLLLVVLLALCLANIGWRVWSGRGRITIDAKDKPVAEVIRSLERQAGIRIGTNLPADAKVTMHVRKVPLLHALEVLSAHTGANWSVAYFAAPDKGSIDAALATMASGQELEGWKRWSMPPMRGFDGDNGSSDPRLEEWKTKPLPEGTLHAYLGQAANVLSAQFWAPEQWNPSVSAPPKAGKITKVMPKLASAVRGRSAEVFLLRGRRAQPQLADAGSDRTRTRNREGGDGDRIFRGGPPSEEMQKAMEERARAAIERLPKDKQAEALARLEERRKFSQEMAKLSPEERRAKMEEMMEQRMNSGDAARLSTEGAKRGAMQNADQRAERYKGYLDRKREASN